ncbi:hypothetical protein [Psychrobacter sp. Choline-02u-9]|nr:hypothetical protein [Psychrobacter sp. Choline-02u-9]
MNPLPNITATLRPLGNAQPWRFFVAFFMTVSVTIDKTEQTLCLDLTEE